MATEPIISSPPQYGTTIFCESQSVDKIFSGNTPVKNFEEKLELGALCFFIVLCLALAIFDRIIRFAKLASSSKLSPI